jgi:hypothetical protein
LAPKKEQLWAIWNDRVGVFSYTITDRRTLAINEHMDRQGATWEACRSRGDKVVKVMVEVIE